MSSTILGQLRLDDNRLAIDLARLEQLPYPQEKYGEFTSGRWINLPLFNASGEYDDGVFRDFDGKAKPTTLMSEVPYIAEVLSENFSLDRLIMARLRNVLDWFIIPHRDFLELAGPGENYYRVLVVLEDNEHCVNSDENMVFRMEKGQVWRLDATQIHSAINPSTKSRWTLCLDFKIGRNFTPEQIFAFPGMHDNSIQPTLVERRPVVDLHSDLIRHLGSLITLHNAKDMAFALGKVHFTREVSVGQSWEWMLDIAKASGNTLILEQVEGAVQFFLGEREMQERFTFTAA